MNYIMLGLVAVGITGVFGFWRLIEHFKYELNFRESLLFFVVVLLLTVLCLTNFDYLNINIDFASIGFVIVIYFLILLLLYYVTRSIRLNKYIPMKIILAYVVMSVACFVVLFAVLEKPVSNIDGWDALGLLVFYAIFCIAYVVLLMLTNLVFYILHTIKMDKIDLKNVNYEFNKYSYLGALMMFVIIGCIFGVSYYNELNYNTLLRRQNEIVIDYLSEEYPNHEFEITDMRKTEVDCIVFCNTPVIRNEVIDKTTNQTFRVDVKIDGLTIYRMESLE